MVTGIRLLVAVVVAFSGFTFKHTAPMTLDDCAAVCGISVEEFTLISSVVEAESNRQAPAEGEDTTEGRVYIALTILNRVNDDRFPDTITGVLTQRGQFSTVRNGHSVTDRTSWSDQAVIDAYEWIATGDYPEVYFFNCRGYFSSRTAVGEFGGNYFSGF